MNFKHNQKVRFNWNGEETNGTYHISDGGHNVHWKSAIGNDIFYSPRLLTNLRPALKSFDDPQVGDVYVDKRGDKRHVLGVAGKVIFLSYANEPDSYRAGFTKKQIIEDGYTILQDEEEGQKSERVRVLEEVEEEVKKLSKPDLLSNPDFDNRDVMLGYQNGVNKVLSRIQQLKDKK